MNIIGLHCWISYSRAILNEIHDAVAYNVLNRKLMTIYSKQPIRDYETMFFSPLNSQITTMGTNNKRQMLSHIVQRPQDMIYVVKRKTLCSFTPWIMVTICGGHTTTYVVNQSSTCLLLIKGVLLNLMTRSEFFHVHLRSHSKLVSSGGILLSHSKLVLYLFF